MRQYTKSSLRRISPPNPGPARPVVCARDCAAMSAEIHQLAEALGNAMDAKDRFTRLHSDEVAVVAHSLALYLGLTPSQADAIHIAGHLHDIGKIGLPDRILLKPGPLDPDEWELMRQHPAMGAAILAPVSFLAASGVVDMVRHHHERYDGRGYPDGLSGGDIPLGARIIAVADSLSAMLQNRPYRPCLDMAAAIRDIARQAGAMYDPTVVKALLDNLDVVCALLRGTRFPSPCAACLT